MNFERKVLIGMVHLKPLPGSYHYEDNFTEIIEHAISEARKIENTGFDAIMIENFNDVPFSKTVEPITVASMSVIAKAIKEEISLPLGINVLRNDAIAAYSIAYAVKADFIRVNVLSGVAYTDQGIIEGAAHELANLRKLLPSKIKIFADVHVKHAYHFGDFEEALNDTIERGLADAVIISGKRTGNEVNLEKLKISKELSSVPVLVGSGTTYENLPKLWKYADGFIIGTWIKKEGKTKNEIDAERARKIVELATKLRKNL
ncbi:BtpA/SgcQ family protein [Thermococcus argininiproducens]|uniref:BtpA/SgcQ family protein n=1 Tax=Thermococcus argininiproducens TaxID=2866384 RepID=A0A9E7MCI7_9EURY|nr:BtpA/SgcQ family protein [Thermococcus argininiproducens]USH00773.1 BtpA/SgcQ family protein [Thermococcus argininiproducens]